MRTWFMSKEKGMIIEGMLIKFGERGKVTVVIFFVCEKGIVTTSLNLKKRITV